jgi:hypothetical protein
MPAPSVQWEGGEVVAVGVWTEDEVVTKVSMA